MALPVELRTVMSLSSLGIPQEAISFKCVENLAARLVSSVLAPRAQRILSRLPTLSFCPPSIRHQICHDGL